MGRIILSICAVVVAALLVGAAPPPSQDNQAEQAEATRDLTQAVEALSRTVAKQAEADKASLLEHPCEPGEDERQSDLCAQWKAADAAREAARWAFWSTLVGVAGVVGLVMNLQQGRAGLALAAKQFENGFKPWLVCRTGGRIDDEKSLSKVAPDEPNRRTVTYFWWLTIESIGDMPAVIVGVRYRQLDSGEWKNEMDEIYYPLAKGEKVTIGAPPENAGAVLIEAPITIITCKLTRENHTDVVMTPPGVAVEIDYLDPVGKKRTLGVGFKPMRLYDTITTRTGGQLYNFDRDA